MFTVPNLPPLGTEGAEKDLLKKYSLILFPGEHLYILTWFTQRSAEITLG